jgi:hypothetical protein
MSQATLSIYPCESRLYALRVTQEKGSNYSLLLSGQVKTISVENFARMNHQYLMASVIYRDDLD